VPVSIVRKDLIPKMQPSRLFTRYGIRILDQKNNELTAGAGNWFSDEAITTSSSRIRRAQLARHDAHQLPERARRLHARHAVQELFGDDVRFDSSGCMRIQNVRDLWCACCRRRRLVAHRDRRRDQVPANARNAKLKPPVPLHLGST